MDNNSYAQQDHLANINNLEIEGPVRASMQSIALWTKICAIAGFVNVGLSIVSIGVTYSRFESFGGSYPIRLLLTTLVTLAVSFFINLFLFHFSRNLKQSLDTDNQEHFARSSLYLKNYFRMIIIMVIVSVILGMIGGATSYSVFNIFK